MLIAQVADRYQPPSMDIGDPEKYYWPKAMCRFEQYGLQDSLANAYVDTLSARPPFHFTLLGMARLMLGYAGAPTIQQNRDQILRQVLAREDGLNAFTGEGTENHVGMSRTSGYLFAQEAAKMPKSFPRAKALLDSMKNWVMVWGRALYRHGPGEWNSSIYAPYNFMGWLNLYDFAEDREVRSVARAVLDFYAMEMALHYSWGTLGGAEMRGNGLRKVSATASDYYMWYWFAPESTPIDWYGSQYIQLIHGITSSYRPPAAIAALAVHKDTPNSSAWYTGHKPSYLYQHPQMVSQYLYKADRFVLGSCSHRFAGYTGATAQVVNWKLVIKPAAQTDVGKPGTQVFGNGLFYDDWRGKGSQPFTQVGQYRNLFFQLTRQPVGMGEFVQAFRKEVPAWQEHWLHDYHTRFPMEEARTLEETPIKLNGKLLQENKSYLSFPLHAQIEKLGRRHFLVNIGGVNMLVSCLGQNVEQLQMNKHGLERHFLIDQAPDGVLCGFVLELLEGEAAQKPTAENLPELTILASDRFSYRSREGGRLEVQFQRAGEYQVPIFDWGYGPTEPKALQHLMPFRQPAWPSGEGSGRQANWFFWEQGKKVFDSQTPEKNGANVYAGPGLQLRHGTLRLTTLPKPYVVDFSGRVPKFQ